MKRILTLGVATGLALSSAYAAKMRTQVYGYVEGYVEKVEKQPSLTGGSATTPASVERSENPHEFQTPHVNLMVKSTKGPYSSFLNLDASDGVTVKNAWVESKIKGEGLKMRIGKLYRRFGLYNERLDAVPTYIGIEPPELFDGDHLLLTRTTNFMLHGEKDIAGNPLQWAIMTGNDERAGSEIPLGADVRYTYYGDNFELLVGSSFYDSKKSVPSVAVGSGSPNGGVINWMKEDKYKVFGIFTELKKEALTFQFAYYSADHAGIREGSKLQNITSGLNQRQIDRLCSGNMSTCADSVADYKIKTWYVRTGYALNTSWGELTPYVQWDYYENPETIFNKDNGGDKEAGLADDGKFTKQTVGVVYRPDPQIAYKVDASNHSQKVNGQTSNYAEIRGSFSYIWSL